MWVGLGHVAALWGGTSINNRTLTDNVQLYIDSFPVQVFLKVSGAFTSGYPEVGQISHRLEGSTAVRVRC
ncbi:MAG: hypothetical protein Q7U82_09975 [Gammaproteobacteria bacterium]|nr:hypothetical protein [Gammaproteobacteria bacterium]